MWGGDRDATATRIGIEVAAVTVLAIIGLLLFNPSLGSLGTALVVAVLIALDAVTILALLRVFPRIRSWWQERRSNARLNRHPIIIPEMVRLVERTERAFYQNAVGTLLYMTRVLTQPEETLPNEVLGHGQAFRGLMEMSKTQGPWERGRFVTLVRSVVIHFSLADSVLDRLYAIATRREIDDQTLAQWGNFRERYNQLRSDWQRFSDEMYAIIGLSADVPGNPARELRFPSGAPRG